ncbi:MAG TPA: hypothetical protein VIM75_15585 [Ohtaekwangia sp.]|uniref:hypothetical protein n=1 Tax=Ohtaekwangia sp. TaxID=2066019 RepID=UPI002F95A3A8
MQQLVKLYRLLNLLSVDVAAGAVCSALFFARILNVHILPYGLVALGLSVWIIYTADHLLDAYKIKAPAATERHRFHQKHFRLLALLLLIAVSINGIIILYIRHTVFVAGLYVGGTVSIYFLINRYLKFLKEFFIAIVYTIGVILPSVSVAALPAKEWPWMTIAQFCLTALINLILFSWFDHERDKQDNNISFVTILGEKTTRIFIWILFGLAIFITGIHISLADIIILLMNVVLLIIFVASRYFAISDRFRLVGDFVFVMPAIYLFF